MSKKDPTDPPDLGPPVAEIPLGPRTWFAVYVNGVRLTYGWTGDKRVAVTICKAEDPDLSKPN